MRAQEMKQVMIISIIIVVVVMIIITNTHNDIYIFLNYF